MVTPHAIVAYLSLVVPVVHILLFLVLNIILLASLLDKFSTSENTYQTTTMNETAWMSKHTYTPHQYSYFKHEGEDPNKAKLHHLEEMYDVMMRVQNQKVGYLKTAVFELQRQNAVLINEVIRCNSRECVDSSEKHCFELIDSVKHPREVLAPNSGYFQKVLDLEQKITQLEEELKQHRNLVQQQDLQVKSLLKTRQKLTDEFHKELKLQKKKAESEVQAVLLEEKAKHLLIQANQGIERTKQFETSISTFYDKFQDVLLAAQAKSSQSRHHDLQRIIELEQKLRSSVTTL